MGLTLVDSHSAPAHAGCAGSPPSPHLAGHTHTHVLTLTQGTLMLTTYMLAYLHTLMFTHTFMHTCAHTYTVTCTLTPTLSHTCAHIVVFQNQLEPPH